MLGDEEPAPNSRTLELEREAEPGSSHEHPPLLFVVLEASRPYAGGARFSLEGIDEVIVGRGPARSFAPPEGQPTSTSRILRVPDRLISSRHARFFLKDGELWFEDLGSRNGSKVDQRRVTAPVTLDDRALVEIGGTFVIVHLAPDSKPRLRALDYEKAPPAPLGTTTLLPGFEMRLSDLAQIAIVDVPVLLLGETGTGKELLARAVHELSGRSGAFVPVNCGALPETLVESSLFGHARGAFSGAARDEPGLIRASHRGTLFLDEIGELEKPSQSALLRVLQEREVVPVGGTKAVPVDLRVVAATHQAIDGRSSDTFRADLYARLAGFTLRLPPLRERREDLGVIIAGILRQSFSAQAKELRLGPGLASALLSYEFPYNARELQQLLSVGAALVSRGPLDLDQTSIPEALRAALTAKPSPARETASDSEASALRDALVAQLRSADGNISKVSRAMGKTRTQIHRWMKRFGIDPSAFRG